MITEVKCQEGDKRLDGPRHGVEMMGDSSGLSPESVSLCGRVEGHAVPKLLEAVEAFSGRTPQRYWRGQVS
jgi:hypothetical protein